MFESHHFSLAPTGNWKPITHNTWKRIQDSLRDACYTSLRSVYTYLYSIECYMFNIEIHRQCTHDWFSCVIVVSILCGRPPPLWGYRNGRETGKNDKVRPSVRPRAVHFRYRGGCNWIGHKSSVRHSRFFKPPARTHTCLKDLFLFIYSELYYLLHDFSTTNQIHLENSRWKRMRNVVTLYRWAAWARESSI